MRINGWLRLWVVATLTWLTVVAYYTWHTWPRPEAISHIPEFISKARPQSALFDCPSSSTKEECEKLATLILEMPNGYRLLLSTTDSDPNTELAANSYWDAVEIELRNKLNSFVLSAGMLWLCPSLAVLLLGFGITWVKLGFRQHHA